MRKLLILSIFVVGCQKDDVVEYTCVKCYQNEKLMVDLCDYNLPPSAQHLTIEEIAKHYEENFLFECELIP